MDNSTTTANLDEYKLLNEKIINRTTIIHNIWNCSYATVAAILAFAVSSDNIWLFPLVHCIIIPTLLIQTQQILTIWKTQAYLSVFFDNTEFHYENLRSEFNDKIKKSKNINKVTKWRGTSALPYIALSLAPIVCIIIKIINDYCSREFNIITFIPLAISLIFFILVLIMRVVFYNVSIRENYVEIWKALK